MHDVPTEWETTMRIAAQTAWWEWILVVVLFCAIVYFTMILPSQISHNRKWREADRYRSDVAKGVSNPPYRLL